MREKLQDLEGGFADCDAALDLISKDKRGNHDFKSLAAVYRLRAWIQQRRGKSREAIADCKTAIDLCPPGQGEVLASLLNTRAYICALSGLELETGLKDVNRALEGQQDNSEILDTRGYLLLKSGKPEPALADLQSAIRSQEEKRRDLTLWIRDADPQAFRSDTRQSWRYTMEEMDRSLAVMYRHRGEVYEKLGKAEKARTDFERATQLGYNPANGVL